MQLFEAFVRLLDEAPAERQHTQFVLQLRELELLKVCTALCPSLHDHNTSLQGCAVRLVVWPCQ